MRALVFVAVVGSLAFAPAPFPRTERRRVDDPHELRGIWQMTSSEMQGVQEAPSNLDYLVEITAETLTFIHKSSKSRASTYELRQFRHSAPPAFSWSRDNAVMFVGSYRLQKDELTLVFNGGSRIENRPTDFDGKPAWRYRMRRVQR